MANGVIDLCAHRERRRSNGLQAEALNSSCFEAILGISGKIIARLWQWLGGWVSFELRVGTLIVRVRIGLTSLISRSRLICGRGDAINLSVHRTQILIAGASVIAGRN